MDTRRGSRFWLKGWLSCELPHTSNTICRRDDPTYVLVNWISGVNVQSALYCYYTATYYPANFDRAVDVRQSCMSLSLLRRAVMPQAPANCDRAVDVRQSCMSLSLLRGAVMPQAPANCDRAVDVRQSCISSLALEGPSCPRLPLTATEQ